jgi:hypothetical protein
MNSIKDMVKDKRQVVFQFYRKGYLYYKTECGFIFPVPISDTGDGQFNAQDNAMLFMRYIRKEVKAIEAALKEAESLEFKPL